MPEFTDSKAKITTQQPEVAEWVERRLGLPPNQVGGVRINLDPGSAVTANVTVYLTLRDLQELGFGDVPTKPTIIA